MVASVICALVVTAFDPFEINSDNLYGRSARGFFIVIRCYFIGNFVFSRIGEFGIGSTVITIFRPFVAYGISLRRVRHRYGDAVCYFIKCTFIPCRINGHGLSGDRDCDARGFGTRVVAVALGVVPYIVGTCILLFRNISAKIRLCRSRLVVRALGVDHGVAFGKCILRRDQQGLVASVVGKLICGRSLIRRQGGGSRLGDGVFHAGRRSTFALAHGDVCGIGACILRRCVERCLALLVYDRRSGNAIDAAIDRCFFAFASAEYLQGGSNNGNCRGKLAFMQSIGIAACRGDGGAVCCIRPIMHVVGRLDGSRIAYR